MPTPLAALAGAALVAAGGFGVGSVIVGSGGTSKVAATKPPVLSADPTGRPDHSRYTYQPNSGVQRTLPGAPAAGGAAPNVGPGPGAGPSYVPHGKVSVPLGAVPTPASIAPKPTWPLYLSGGDQLQPDPSAAVATDQTIGPALGDACSTLGQAGHWTAPPPDAIAFHGTAPGLLHVIASGSVTLQISFTASIYGGGCAVLSSTTVTASGTQDVAFTLPRMDASLPLGVNVSLVVAASGTARIESHTNALSYVVAPTPEQ